MHHRIVVLTVILILLVFGINQLTKKSDRETTTGQGGTEASPSAAETKKVLHSYNNIVLEYSTSNGSLPPPYHRDTDMNLSKSANGELKGVKTISDYEKVLETKTIALTDDQFKELVDSALKLESESGSLSGCTGGTGASVRLSQAGNMLLEVAGNNCGGKTTNAGLNDFTSKIKKLY